MEITAESVAADRAAIETEGRTLADVASAGWDRPVPTCPGWTAGMLLPHTSGTHRWAVANLTSGERVRRSQVPPPPEGRDAELAWYAEGLAALIDAAGDIDPEAPVWTFAASGERRSAWWLRRMAQETTMHRWDAESALGSHPSPPDPRSAKEGVDEYLLDFLPRLPAEMTAGWSGTLHLHATDTDGEWMLDLGDMTRPARLEHGRADSAVRGPAADLLLWLWNRQPPEGLEAFGDTTILDRWRQVRI
jgi:uncharacterized protein (TIGR03083 family)